MHSRFHMPFVKIFQTLLRSLQASKQSFCLVRELTCHQMLILQICLRICNELWNIGHSNEVAHFGTKFGIFLQKSFEIDCKAHELFDRTKCPVIKKFVRSIAISDRTMSVDRPLFRALFELMFCIYCLGFHQKIFCYA